MNCPIDNTDLQMTERQGVEIDYCPKCRGVWLDRGELDKIIDRSDELTEPPAREDRGRNYEDEKRYSSHKKQKRGGFLGEMFDF